MSDIFNKGKQKYSVLDILLTKVQKLQRNAAILEAESKGIEYSETVESFMMPPPLQIKSEVVKDSKGTEVRLPISKYNTMLLESLLTKYRVPVREPRVIRELEVEDVSALLGPELQAYLEYLDEKHNMEGNEPWKVKIATSSKLKLPAYYPNYKNVEANMELVKKVYYDFIMLPDEFRNNDLVSQSMKDFNEIVQNNILSSGTLEGQIKRISDAVKTKIGDSPAGNYRCRSVIEGLTAVGFISKGELDKISDAMDELYPLHSATLYKINNDTTSHVWKGLYASPSHYIKLNLIKGMPDDQNPIMDFLPSFYNTVSGLPYPSKVKKKDVVIENISMSDMFYNGIRLGMNGLYSPTSKRLKLVTETENEKVASILSVLGEFWWMSCCYLSPKEERYTRKEVEQGTKTRNIYMMPTPTYIFQAMIQKPVTEYTPNVLTSDNWNLLHFSPFHGGMNILIEKLLDIDEDYVFLNYSDNLYMMYKEDDSTYTWFSLDLEKGESQNSPEDIRLLNFHLLKKGHISDSGRPMFNTVWSYMAMNVLPSMQADATSLIGNVQLKTPGLASGAYATQSTNHVRSSGTIIGYKHVFKNKKCRPGSEEWNSFCKKMGVKWKIERQIQDVKTKLKDLVINTPHQGVLQDPNVDDPYPIPLPTVELDLLGFGVAWSHVTSSYLPVLEKDRFMASLAYQHSVNMETLATEVFHVLPEDLKDSLLKHWRVLSVENSLYISGGWAYGSIGITIFKRLREAQTAFANALARLGGRVSETSVFTKAVERGLKELIEESPMFRALLPENDKMDEADYNKIYGQVLDLYQDVPTTITLGLLHSPIPYTRGVDEDGEPITTYHPYPPSQMQLIELGEKNMRQLKRQLTAGNKNNMIESRLISELIVANLDKVTGIKDSLLKFRDLDAESKSKLMSSIEWEQAKVEFETFNYYLGGFHFEDFDLGGRVTTIQGITNPYLKFKRHITSDGQWLDPTGKPLTPQRFLSSPKALITGAVKKMPTVPGDIKVNSNLDLIKSERVKSNAGVKRETTTRLLRSALETKFNFSTDKADKILSDYTIEPLNQLPNGELTEYGVAKSNQHRNSATRHNVLFPAPKLLIMSDLMRNLNIRPIDPNWIKDSIEQTIATFESKGLPKGSKVTNTLIDYYSRHDYLQTKKYLNLLLGLASVYSSVVTERIQSSWDAWIGGFRLTHDRMPTDKEVFDFFYVDELNEPIEPSINRYMQKQKEKVDMITFDKLYGMSDSDVQSYLSKLKASKDAWTRMAHQKVSDFLAKRTILDKSDLTRVKDFKKKFGISS